MQTVEELRAAHEQAVKERAALQGEIIAYRRAHPKPPGVSQQYSTDGDGIPNTMDYRRVTLDTAVVRSRQALENAGGSVVEAAPAVVVSEVAPAAVEEPAEPVQDDAPPEGEE